MTAFNLNWSTPRRPKTLIGTVCLELEEEGEDEDDLLLLENEQYARLVGKLDQQGCFVYRAISPVAVRRAPSVHDDDKVEDLVVRTNDLIAVDCIRQGSDPGPGTTNTNGPFLRLADGSGWLFEQKEGRSYLQRVNVQDGLWSFVADNFPSGVSLRRDPNDRTDNFVMPMMTYRPMQTIHCDKRIKGHDGINFYRVQGTQGWLFDRRGDDYMIIPERSIRRGLFVYVAVTDLVVRSRTTVSEESKTAFVIRKGQLVAADIIRHSPNQGADNGPFLRLTDRSGWLFEYKYSDQVLQSLPVEVGTWMFRVWDEPCGIGVRRQPIDSQDFFTVPERLLEPGEAIVCDRKVRGPDGVCYYRLENGEGWLFDRRGSQRTLHEMWNSPTAAVASRTSGSPWTPDYVRKIAATVPGMSEIGFHVDNQVISFRTENGVRINVYYATKTVGTAMDDPVQGRTELFRRDCGGEELRRALEDPRVHIGRCRSKDVQDSSSIGSHPFGTVSSKEHKSEEEAMRASLQAFDDEIELLMQRRSKLLGQVMMLDEDKAKRASKDHELVAIMHQESTRQKSLQQKMDKQQDEETRRKSIEREKQADKDRKRKKLEGQKRGDKIECFMFHAEDIHLDGTASLIAMGGEATAILDENGNFHSTSWLTSDVRKLLYQRDPSLPRPTYIALGSNDRYFVQFENGEKKWSESERTSFHGIVSKNDDLRFVAFGPAWDSYVLATESFMDWNNVPRQLDWILRGTRPIQSVSLGPNGEFFVAWKDGGFKGGGWSQDLLDKLVEMKGNGWHVRDMKFGESDTYIIRYSAYTGRF